MLIKLGCSPLLKSCLVQQVRPFHTYPIISCWDVGNALYAVLKKYSRGPKSSTSPKTIFLHVGVGVQDSKMVVGLCGPPKSLLHTQKIIFSTFCFIFTQSPSHCTASFGVLYVCDCLHLPNKKTWQKSMISDNRSRAIEGATLVIAPSSKYSHTKPSQMVEKWLMNWGKCYPCCRERGASI